MLRVLVRRLPGMHKAWSPPSPVPSKSAIPALGQSSLPVESRVSLGHGKVKPCSLKKKKKKSREQSGWTKARLRLWPQSHFLARLT